MELRVNVVSIPEAITFNYEELKAELLQKASVYESMVYTEDQIKEAKADRANLNRLKTALNAERLKREKEYMKPFDDFKAKINEIIRIIDRPASAIDKQVKAAEERQKEEKLGKIKAYFEAGSLFGEPASKIVAFDKIFDPRWLNASASMKSITGAIDARMEQVANDLSVVRSLPAYAFEAEQAYIQTLDLAKAVSEAHRLQDMAEKKAAFEADQARKRAEAEVAAYRPVVMSAPISGAENVPAVTHAEPVREWVRFQALMTVEEAKALGQYMREHGIKYKSV